MTTYTFDPSQSFEEVRRIIDEINGVQHKGLLARLTWRDGSAKDQSVTYLYDEFAERFGHSIDKSGLHTEILASLFNGIPVEIELVPRPQRTPNGIGQPAAVS